MVWTFEINPARAYACGDEAKDFHAAIGAGMHPFMVSYGFEGLDRLQIKHEIPAEIIARSPDELAWRVLHALGADADSELPSGGLLAARQLDGDPLGSMSAV